MGAVVVSHVEKSYGNQGNITQALSDISFAVEKREFIAAMGVSGNGKTILLNVIPTIDAVSAGNIEANGNSICELRENELAEFRKKELGSIFQDFNPLDTLTLQENIALLLTLLKKKAEQTDPQVNALAEILQIQDILEKYPYQVNGGQRQWRICARAMTHDPSLIPADEPTGALNSHSSYLLIEQPQRINTELWVTVLTVTHDVSLTPHVRRVLFLKDGIVLNEIYRGSLTRKAFPQKVLDVMQLLGGDVYAVR